MMGVKITGLNELKAKLQRLGQEVQQQIGKQATGRMAAIVRDDARARVHLAKGAYLAGPKGGRTLVEPGHVARNVIMKRMAESQRRGLTSEHIVTVSNSQDGPLGAKNIGVFLEYGINMPRPYPFMRPAYDAKQAEATAAAKQIIETELQKLWTQK